MSRFTICPKIMGVRTSAPSRDGAQLRRDNCEVCGCLGADAVVCLAFLAHDVRRVVSDYHLGRLHPFDCEGEGEPFAALDGHFHVAAQDSFGGYGAETADKQWLDYVKLTRSPDSAGFDLR